MRANSIARLWSVLSAPERLRPAVIRRIRRTLLSPRLAERIIGPDREFDVYRRELTDSTLLEHLNAELARFDQLTQVDGDTKVHGSGVMSFEEGIMLYALVRRLAPDLIVETGVCNGLSSALILEALRVNHRGHLHSIDLPEVMGEQYTPGTFWDGKGSAVVPRGKNSGWLIPAALRDRWVLHLGKSQELLGPLLERLGPIDMFIHDSEHSYECMMFEYSAAFPVLRSGGLLISDDIFWNSAFFDFARARNIRAGRIGKRMGLIVKA
jgi:predicted O-methyltransferase YrrM